jgi:hypothetical protein
VSPVKNDLTRLVNEPSEDTGVVVAAGALLTVSPAPPPEGDPSEEHAATVADSTAALTAGRQA